MFTDWKIQGFPIGLLSVNLNIRSFIRYFPIAVNPGKRMFSGIYRSVDTHIAHILQNSLESRIAAEHVVVKAKGTWVTLVLVQPSDLISQT